MGDQKTNRSLAAFKSGAVSLAFIIIGYQAALFMQRAAELRIVANRDRPDTVYVVKTVKEDATGRQETFRDTVKRKSSHSRQSDSHYSSSPHRKIENFRFNPNTVSVEDLLRLGFSQKQAQSIEAYRQKGGRFRRKSDFKKSYAVADSVYERLERFIEIPKVDINKADSAAFDALPGIGPYFAAKMVSFREELGGYSCIEQLMDIYHFDPEKFDGLKDLVECSPGRPFRLWSLPPDSLRHHPYIRSWQTARAIVIYRENNPPDRLTVDGLFRAGILDSLSAMRLSRCDIMKP